MTPAPLRTPGSGNLRLPPTEPQFTTLGDYEIVSKLGQGGMGAVYRARQVSLDRFVALKVLPSQFEEDEDFVGRFRREATIAASLNHPNVVRVYASGQADGVHYIAMELVEGENLRQFLKRSGPMAPADALRICVQVARGLQCGWDRAQLIHRDIKPSNIYLSLNGDVKVGDLGLAKSLLSNTTGITHTGTAIGTPHYVSPEQARGEKGVDCRADIYSLGCTLYELLTGATPYQGSDPLTVMAMHLNAPAPAILKVLPQCPLPVGRLVSKMLRKGRHERPQNYDELIAAMEAALDQIERPATGPSAVVEAWKEIGKAEQGFLPARGSSPTRTAANSSASRTGQSAAPRKAWRTWTGVAAAVVLVAGLAYAFVHREVPTSAKARNVVPQQIAASDPSQTSGITESAEPLAPATSADPVATPPAAAALTPAPVKIFDPGTLPPGKGYRFENGALRIDATAVHSFEPRKNVALRAEVLMSPDSRNPQIAVRSRTDRGAGSYYDVNLLAAEQKVSLEAWVEGERQALGSWPLPRVYRPEEWLPIELSVIEDEITVSAGGAVLAMLRDGKVPQPGGLKLYAAAAGRFRNVEYVPLDGLAPAAARLALANAPTSAGVSATSTAPAYPQPDAWIDATEEVRSSGAADGTLTSDGEWLVTAGRHSHRRLAGEQTFTDAIARVVYRDRVVLKMRRNAQGSGYAADIVGGKARIALFDGGNFEVLSPWSDFPPTHAPDAPHEAVFAAEGSQLRLWVDGQLVATATDQRLTSGTIELICMVDATLPVARVRKAEYGRLVAEPRSR